MTQASFPTHEVFNQSPPFSNVDLFTFDRPLVEAVTAYGGASAQHELSQFGKHWGSAAMAERGRLANEIRQSSGPSIPAASGATRTSSIRPIMN